MRYIIWISLFLIMSTIWADDSAPKPKPKKTPNWIVEITLKTETEIQGIVLDNKFIEKLRYGRYREIKSYREEGAGIRVWYVRQSTGFTFIPYKQIKKMKKKNLSNTDLAKIRLEVEERSKKAQQDNIVRPPVVPIVGNDPKKPKEEPKNPNIEPAPEKSREEIYNSLPQDAKDFLDRFPIEEGWGPERFAQLSPRFNSPNITPGQKTFVTAFRRYGALVMPLYEFDRKNN